MRQLILLRHGEAEPRAASGRDLDRALTLQGRRDAAHAGAELAAAGLSPDRVLVSPACRTQETWTAVAAAFGDVPAHVVEGLYDGPADDLLDAAQACAVDAVMLVAHNPGLGELAARLGGGATAFPPAALAIFDWGEEGPRLRLRWAPR